MTLSRSFDDDAWDFKLSPVDLRRDDGLDDNAESRLFAELNLIGRRVGVRIVFLLRSGVALEPGTNFVLFPDRDSGQSCNQHEPESSSNPATIHHRLRRSGSDVTR